MVSYRLVEEYIDALLMMGRQRIVTLFDSHFPMSYLILLLFFFSMQALYFCVPFREQLLEYYANNKNIGDAEENLLTCLADLFTQVNIYPSLYIHTQHTHTYSNVRFLVLYKICLCVYTHIHTCIYLNIDKYLFLENGARKVCNIYCLKKFVAEQVLASFCMT